jgi:hypothetical protein
VGPLSCHITVDHTGKTREKEGEKVNSKSGGQNFFGFLEIF